ncbi:TRAFAC clade GTPase domain-containing protein [Arthrobacter yangruifuii]|uniref:TRAFAC clade GTPase domain-containing protein n=1 Tax=Arthrobacter yangruifuii TaxID=2606616 RepID=UPI0011B5BAE2|nr:hypothetical protein [Arthrobacter yangruifuii]
MLSLFSSAKSTACPYCYAELNVGKVAFRCSGRGAPGRTPCKPVPDRKREEVFSDGTPVLPAISEPGQPEGQKKDLLGKSTVTCSDCGGESGIRMCPSCHSILPRGIDNNSPLFGLIGVRNSGKTVLLSVLHRELVQSVARRFDAAIDTPGGSSGLARDLAMFEKDMAREGGSLPPQTAASGTVKKTPAVYEWKYSRKGKTASTIFSFYDTAGEDVSRQETAMMQQYLGQASGVILLLDPFAFSENRERAEQLGAAAGDADTPESALDGITYVLQTAHNVKNNKKIKVPLAVVVSKIDAFFDQIPASHPLRQPSSSSSTFDDAESRTIHDHVMALVANWGGDGLLRKLEHEYDNFRLFGVSALGAEPDYRSGSVSSRGLLPHRVADPLLWLMADRGFIPKSEG